MKIVFDEFNSSIFGLNMANVVLDGVASYKEIKALVNNCLYDHLSVKIDTDEKDSFDNFIKNGFYLVDTQVTYEFKNINSQILTFDNVRKLKAEDIEEVLEIARDSFSIDRFHSDFNLDLQKANNYYEKWAYNLSNNNEIISHVFAENGVVCGFSFWSIKENYATLILIAVAKNQRMKGVYSNLINFFIVNLPQGINTIYMGTQINNYGVHKYWGARGAYIKSSKYVLHFIKK